MWQEVKSVGNPFQGITPIELGRVSQRLHAVFEEMDRKNREKATVPIDVPRQVGDLSAQVSVLQTLLNDLNAGNAALKRRVADLERRFAALQPSHAPGFPASALHGGWAGSKPPTERP